MKLLFIGLVLAYFLTFLIRMIMASIYAKKHSHYCQKKINEKDFTIVQPILSGDENLRSCLIANLKNFEKMSFIWLIDKKDQLAQRIAKEIIKKPELSKRVTIKLFNDVAPNKNPKVFKLKSVVDKLKTKYLIVLDDDSIIESTHFGKIWQSESISTPHVITGLPYSNTTKGFFSLLVSSFVNSNAHLTYLPLALIKKNHSLNGMFYILPTSLAKKQDLFQKIENELCDDYAVARYIESINGHIIQSTIPCEVSTSIIGFRHYLRLMKRWLIFSNYYFKNQFSIELVGLILVPAFIPFLLLVLASALGFWYLLILFALMFFKSAINLLVRKNIYGVRQKIIFVLIEPLTDLLQFLHCLHASISPHTIFWRNKKISFHDNQINYEV